MAIDWSALTTVGAAFAGATCAQVLAHLFTLRRDGVLRKQAVDSYITHIKFDYVLGVSKLELILRHVELANDAEEFGWHKIVGSYNTNYPILLDRLDFEMNVDPRFMFNARKWFALSTQDVERYRGEEASKATRVSLDFINSTLILYLQGLAEIVFADRMVRGARRWPFRKKGWTYSYPPAYEDIVVAYKEIEYPLPNKRIFELAVSLSKFWDKKYSKRDL